ncbi:porin [uncultured Sutterella sp.]|uniref:porin n=1 Tax=uncultured Sutterella sp. TaxID=286133 RepID=UPI0025E45268|nr:porin [uncultured Sutterella sp.]
MPRHPLTALSAALLSSIFLAAAGAAQAADVNVNVSAVTGLFYSHGEGGDGSLSMAGYGQLPDDSQVLITAREDLGNGWYAGAQLRSLISLDSGSFVEDGVIFDALSRAYLGNDFIEFSFGRMAGLTVAGLPYSVYAKLNANQTYASLAGIAPANITFQPGRLSNAVGFATRAKTGLFLHGVYSNGDSKKATGDTEATEDWSDRRHVAQLSTGWAGERFKTGIVYSFEMPGNLKNADGTRDTRRDNTHAVHLIASYDFGGPAVSAILYASCNDWRIGPVPDLASIVGSQTYRTSEKGLDSWAVHVSAKYPVGRHTFSAAAGYLKTKWKGVDAAAGDNKGTLAMGGVVYYYDFSKHTRFYGAASWLDGKKLLDNSSRLNQAIATAGMILRF